MSVKIRLARRGRRKKPYYHIVVADVRAPRDGRFIENLGFYNPMTSPATIQLDVDRAYEWISNGAQPTNTARAILRFKGVLYKKHLQTGVTKGALTQEQADQMLKDWVAAKEAKVAERAEQARQEKEEYRKMLSGELKVVKKDTADDDSKHAFRESNEGGETTATATEVVENVKEDAKAVVEESSETVVETAEEVTEAVSEKVEEAKEKVEEVAEAVVETAKETKEAVEEKVEKVTEAIPEKVEEAKEKVEEVVEAAAESTEEVVEKVKEVVSEKAPSNEEE